MCTASLCTRFGVLRRGAIVGRGCAGTRNDDLFYLWPLRTSLFPQRLRSRIADHRRFFTNFVHAIQDKKKLVYVQPCEFVPPISSSSARIPFSSRIIKFRRYRYGPFFPFLEIFTLERLVSLFNVRLLIHCT